MAVRNSLMNAGNPIFSAFAMEQVSPGERATLSAAMSVLWQVGWVIGGIWYASAPGEPGLRCGLHRGLRDDHHPVHDRDRPVLGLVPRRRPAGAGAAGCGLTSGAGAMTARTGVVGGDGGESNSPSRTLRRRPLRACPMVCRRPPGRASALCRAVQSRAPRSGLTPDYVTLVRIAASLGDASTTREAEVASTLTLLPKQRERESTGGCQVLLFAT